jgi:predicted amidohydrolase
LWPWRGAFCGRPRPSRSSSASSPSSPASCYRKTFGELAREFGTAILAGSLFEVDAESRQIRNRATLFDAGGEVVGWQDKLNPAEEAQMCSPGSELVTLETKLGRMGILIGNDALVPELARLLVLQGAELIVGIAASSSAAQSNALRAALALRAEENQVYGAASFLVGPNFLAQGGRGEWIGQSALLAPFELAEKADGVLAQVGSNRSEGAIFATLQAERLELLRRSGAYRPRQQMNLAGMAPVLAEMYARGLSLEQAIEQRLAGPVGSAVSESAPESTEEPAAAAGEELEPPGDSAGVEA